MRTNVLPGFGLAICALLAASSALAQSDTSHSRRPIGIPDSEQSIGPEEQLLRRDLAFLVAPVKSPSDLARYMADTKDTPMHAMTEKARRRFLDSLTFGARGLSGFRYDDLEAELTPTQIYQVLAIFGQQHNAPFLEHARVETDLDRQILSMESHRKCFGPGQSTFGCQLDFLEDYRCESAGTCIQDNLRACTDNC